MKLQLLFGQLKNVLHEFSLPPSLFGIKTIIGPIRNE